MRDLVSLVCCLADPADGLALLAVLRGPCCRLTDSEILLLVCVQGLSYKEVSERLAIPTGTVRSRLSRARQQMQAALESGTSGAEMLPMPGIHAAARKSTGADAH